MESETDSQNHRITESQNHRMLGVGRDLCGSSSPTLLLKQGLSEQAVQDLVQVGLEYLQRRRLHNLPGQPVQCSVRALFEKPPRRLKNFLPFTCFYLLSLAGCLLQILLWG